jgi:hypothetical protein
MPHRKPESGALGHPTTGSVLRNYARFLILCAVAIVVAINILTSLLLALQPPVFVNTLVGAVVLGLAFSVLGCVFSYARLVLLRAALRRADWQVISVCSRRISVGPVPVAHIVVADFGGGDSLRVGFATPVRFARKLPADLLPANALWCAWRGINVYSGFDGASPAMVVPVFGPLNRLLANIVQRG